MKKLAMQQVEAFRAIVWEHYYEYGRHDLPWRQPLKDGRFDPYLILVSEIMLQQTQVGRVLPKFESFMRCFPTVPSLAQASLADVLREWQGLGYNRRAKFLWQAACMLCTEYEHTFPEDVRMLQALPGVGSNTAGAIAAYAFNEPTLFIETNIRTVYIHHFYADDTDVADTAIRELLSQTLDKEHPRLFYWALMDYGSSLKKVHGNASRLSKAYLKQSPFEGSKRQLRGQVIRMLVSRPHTHEELTSAIADERLSEVLQSLEQESLIVCDKKYYKLFAD